MKKISQLLKRLLFWITALSIFCFVAGGFESLFETDRLAAGFWIVVNIGLVCICHNYLSYSDVYKFSGSELFDRLIKP